MSFTEDKRNFLNFLKMFALIFLNVADLNFISYEDIIMFVYVFILISNDELVGMKKIQFKTPASIKPLCDGS